MARRCAYPAFIGLVALFVVGDAETPHLEPLGPYPQGGQGSLTTGQAIAVGERLRQEQEQGRLLQAGRDPGMLALADCSHYVRNASGAPSLIDQMARDCEARRPEVDKSNPQLKGEVQKCWGPLDSAITFLREANDKYAEARKAVDPMRGQLVKEGNEKQQQAKDEIKKCDTCSEKLFKLAADLGATILKEVMAQLDQMRRGQLPSSARADTTPPSRSTPTPPPPSTRTPTPTGPGSRTTPPPSSSTGAPCPDAATVRSYDQQRAIGATLPNPQRAEYEARLAWWYKNQISECRLEQLNAQLAPYAQGLQQAGDFSFAMRQVAEAMLRATGDISKAMTDASDVTKHNNVGIGIALGGYLGTLGKLGESVRLASREYQKAAAALTAASEQEAALLIGNVAKTQSAIAAERAAQIAREVAREVGPPPIAPPGTTPPVTPPIRTPPVPPPPSAIPDSYLANVEFLTSEPALRQGSLPTCGAYACKRLADLLGRNVSLFQALNRLRPKVEGGLEQKVVDGKTVTEFVLKGGGLTANQLERGLTSLGIPAKVESGLIGLMNEVREGRAVIAMVRTEAAEGAGLHWVVVEGLEERAGVLGFTIYDPGGWTYFQAVSEWQRFFNGAFIRAM